MAGARAVNAPRRKQAEQKRISQVAAKKILDRANAPRLMVESSSPPEGEHCNLYDSKCSVNKPGEAPDQNLARKFLRDNECHEQRFKSHLSCFETISRASWTCAGSPMIWAFKEDISTAKKSRIMERQPDALRTQKCVASLTTPCNLCS